MQPVVHRGSPMWKPMCRRSPLTELALRHSQPPFCINNEISVFAVFPEQPWLAFFSFEVGSFAPSVVNCECMALGCGTEWCTSLFKIYGSHHHTSFRAEGGGSNQSQLFALTRSSLFVFAASQFICSSLDAVTVLDWMSVVSGQEVLGYCGVQVQFCHTLPKEGGAQCQDFATKVL